MLWASILAVLVALGVLVFALRRARDVEHLRVEALAARDQASERLEVARAELARTRSIVDAAAEGVLVLDEGLRIRRTNPAARRMLDVSESCEGRALLESIRNADIARAAERALSGAGLQQAEIRLVPAGEPERILDLRAIPYAARGRVEEVAVLLDDVSSERHLEQVRRDFVANVSHEFRTPLTAIRGFAETLLPGELPAEKRVEFTEKILRHSDRLERLLEDLLTLSEIEAGRRVLEVGPIDVGALAREVAGRLDARFEESGVALEVEDRAGGRCARADRRALEPVLQNLLENALKYTPADGEARVHVEVATEGDRLRLSVADTGIGIPSRDLPRVFERFYRVDRARARGVGGSGVGLAIARHLVEFVGGSIEVASEVERGSTFTVRLPLANV